MSKQGRGEHSRDEELNEDEKPLKKARYVWEIKGKYHLKETYKNNNTISQNNNIIQPNSSTSILNNNNNSSEGVRQTVEEKEEEHKECAKKNKGCCCIQSFLTKTESIMDSDLEDSDLPMNNNLDVSSSNEIPVSLVSLKPKNQDYYLQKWQARQIARGFVDNTINSVLETWNNPPFDAVDFVENCANDGQVEDDAILMAIQSHGLQSSRNLHQLSSREQADMASILSGGLEEFRQDNFENYHKEQESHGSQENCNSDSMSSDSNVGNKTDLEMDDPMDFLNAAVSVAIQKKGLSYGY